MTAFLASVAILVPAPNIATGVGHIPVDHRPAVVAPYRPWLRRLAWCESTNRPWVTDPSGTYHGLYQFDLRTWRSVHGRGLPQFASRLEQGYRAVLLRRRRGTAPWPVCG
jgi:hypothetical protein